jgi:hypothetical protein
VTNEVRYAREPHAPAVEVFDAFSSDERQRAMVESWAEAAFRG